MLYELFLDYVVGYFAGLGRSVDVHVAFEGGKLGFPIELTFICGDVGVAMLELNVAVNVGSSALVINIYGVAFKIKLVINQSDVAFEEIVNGITERYVELYENIVGEKFEKAEGSDILARIEKNVTECLASL
mgnify:CR=1 FL=1